MLAPHYHPRNLVCNKPVPPHEVVQDEDVEQQPRRCQHTPPRFLREGSLQQPHGARRGNGERRNDARSKEPAAFAVHASEQERCPQAGSEQEQLEGVGARRLVGQRVHEPHVGQRGQHDGDAVQRASGALDAAPRPHLAVWERERARQADGVREQHDAAERRVGGEQVGESSV